jgi:hypothetical protein
MAERTNLLDAGARSVIRGIWASLLLLSMIANAAHGNAWQAMWLALAVPWNIKNWWTRRPSYRGRSNG